MANQESCKARSALNIAIIIPCYNESESIGELIKQLNNQFKDIPNHFSYHFLLVNDGSTDDTWKLIEFFSSQSKSRVSGICLSRNFGHQKALLAGLEYASEFADYTICMDADLQHPISAAKEMLDIAINNEKNIVLGQRSADQHSTQFKRITSKLFYKTLNFLGAEISPNVSDFRVMDKQSTLAMIDHGDNTFFSRGIISLIGFNQQIYEYKVAQRYAGYSKYSLRKMLKFAVEGLTSLSTAPLRISFLSSIVLFFLCLALIAYVLNAWRTGSSVPGWTSMLFSIYILFGINFIIIGIQGLYVGKIYLQTLNRPRYIVQKVTKSLHNNNSLF